MYDYYTHIFIFDYMINKKSWQLIKNQEGDRKNGIE